MYVYICALSLPVQVKLRSCRGQTMKRVRGASLHLWLRTVGCGSRMIASSPPGSRCEASALQPAAVKHFTERAQN